MEEKRTKQSEHVLLSPMFFQSPSPVCVAPRGGKSRQNNEVSNYWGPRRSNRMRGIPASEADPENAECNGSNPAEEDESSLLCDMEDAPHSQLCLPLKKRRIAPLEENHIKAEVHADTKKKFRTLLMESERFLHYPSRNSCRMRSTANSQQPSATPPESTLPKSTVSELPAEPEAESSLPHVVDDVEFSFEIVPSGTTWFQTFLRDELQGNDPLPELLPDRPAPFLLPYEMSLESILKSKRSVRAPKKAPPSFRPIISTRLQMQSAAKQSKVAAAELRNSTRRGRRKCGFSMPRKSPRCHASTMAILCSNSVSRRS